MESVVKTKDSMAYLQTGYIIDNLILMVSMKKSSEFNTGSNGLAWSSQIVAKIGVLRYSAKRIGPD